MKLVIGLVLVAVATVATAIVFIFCDADVVGRWAHPNKSNAGPSGQPAVVQPFRLDPVSPLGFSSAVGDGPAPRLEDWAARAGIQFTFFPDARAERMLLPEIMGGGAGWLDFDRDGLQDLFLTNGCRLAPDASDREHVQQLFRQDSPGHFVEVGSLAGVDVTRYGQGCAIGDLDNDGFPEIYLTCYGSNVFFQNNGDGTFSDRTQAAGVRDDGWSTSVAFGDLGRDGDLDLYVAHYATTSIESNPLCMSADGKVRVYCGPKHYQAESDSFFVNHGDGSFTRANQEFGCDPKPAPGLGVVIADLDNDDWPDIYVANDMEANSLFHNRGCDSARRVVMEQVGMQSGAALSGDGRPEASMGVACADFDDDGNFDLFLTHYYQEKNTYYQNHGNLQFDDYSYPSGLAAPSLNYLGFGVVPIDYDLDGMQDLFITNGHVLGKQVRPYAMRPQLFRNVGHSRFVEVTHRAGSYFFDEWVGRGVAAADYDNDGDEDLIVVHHDDRPVALLRNDTHRAGNVLGLTLQGLSSNREGYGTRLEIQAGNRRSVRQVLGGGSYLSCSDRRVLVGLASDMETADVTVHWPSGAVDRWAGLSAGAYWRLVEGRRPFPEMDYLGRLPKGVSMP